MEQLTVQPMAEEDLDVVADIETLCFSDSWSRQTFQILLREPNSTYLTAMLDGRVVGFAGFHKVLDEANIDNVAVLPDYRQQGIAKALVQELLRQARQQGVTVVMLEVRESNLPAQMLYQSFGFYEVGRRPGYYTKPPEDAVLMNLELEENPLE